MKIVLPQKEGLFMQKYAKCFTCFIDFIKNCFGSLFYIMRVNILPGYISVTIQSINS